MSERRPAWLNGVVRRKPSKGGLIRSLSELKGSVKDKPYHLAVSIVSSDHEAQEGEEVFLDRDGLGLNYSQQ